MEIFDYRCTKCSGDFFLEEGYDANEDVIKCPFCGQQINETNNGGSRNASHQ